MRAAIMRSAMRAISITVRRWVRAGAKACARQKSGLTLRSNLRGSSPCLGAAPSSSARGSSIRAHIDEVHSAEFLARANGGGGWASSVPDRY